MKKCYIDFDNEICDGAIGTKEEVMQFLKDANGGKYDYEGVQRIRNREQHKYEKVVVYSAADYFFGTQFVCYKV